MEFWKETYGNMIAWMKTNIGFVLSVISVSFIMALVTTFMPAPIPDKHIFEIGDPVKMKIYSIPDCIVTDYNGDMKVKIECLYHKGTKDVKIERIIVHENELFTIRNFWKEQ